jgi:PHD/YefM family antitoxin component YafN of YafNO toxin-antitoxin module
MPQPPTQPIDHYTTALLCVAEYLSRPQQFVAVAEAHAAFRHTLDMAHQASVVLTTNGEPAAALVSFAALEAMRDALQHLLVEAMEASFVQVQVQVVSAPHAEPTSEAELAALVNDVVQRTRHQSSSMAPSLTEPCAQPVRDP